MRIHGNWCGAGWTAKQYKSSKDLTPADYNVPALGEFDESCKIHDIMLFEAKNDEEVKLANKLFHEANVGKSIFRTAAAVAVRQFGPKTVKDVHDTEYNINFQKAWSGIEPREYLKAHRKVIEPILKKQRLESEPGPPASKKQKIDDYAPDPLPPAPKKQRLDDMELDTPLMLPGPADHEPGTAMMELARLMDQDLYNRLQQQKIQEEFNKDEEYVNAINEAMLITPEANKKREAPNISPEEKEKRQKSEEEPNKDQTTLMEFATDLTGEITQVDEIIENLNTSLLNMSDTTQDVGESEQKRARTAETAITNAKETPISKVLTLERNIFQDTKTVAMPVTFYLSMNRLNHVQGVVLNIRLNHPYNILRHNTLAQQVVPATLSQSRTFGLSNDMVCRQIDRGAYGGSVTSDNKNRERNQWALAPFPTTIKGEQPAINTGAGNCSSSYGEIGAYGVMPKYSKWFTALYEYMSCIGCKYKVTLMNGQDDVHKDQVLIIKNDIASSTASPHGTDTFPTDLNIDDAVNLPGTEKLIVTSRDLRSGHNKEATIVEGMWMPGKNQSVIKNDGENKTWTKTAAQGLSNYYSYDAYVDQQAAFLEKDPYYYEGIQLLGYSKEISSERQACINLQIDLEYIVQFKNLRRSAKYQTAMPPYPANQTIILSTAHVAATPSRQYIERIGILGTGLIGGYNQVNPAVT